MMKLKIMSLIILMSAPVLVACTTLTSEQEPSEKQYISTSSSIAISQPSTEDAEDVPRDEVETITYLDSIKEPTAEQKKAEEEAKKAEEEKLKEEKRRKKVIKKAKADPLYVKVPKKIVKLTEQVGEELGICPELLQSIAWTESGYHQYAINRSGSCKGYMQIMQRYANKRVNELGGDIYDGYTNIRVGGEILLSWLEKSDGDIYLALMEYHGESKAKAKRKEGRISSYAKTIVARSEILEKAHGK